MKVLLVWPNSQNEVLGWGDLGAIAEPLSLEYIAAAARADYHDVRLLDLRLHPGRFGAVMEEYKPDIVGVTAFSMHVRAALAICREAKQYNPCVKTVVGGHHATLLPEDFFEPAVDFVVCGEGTRPFRRLLRALEDNTKSEIKGIWRSCEGSFAYGGDQEPFVIDDLPAPDRTIASEDRKSYFIDWMKPVALIRTSVGCPFRCTYCSLWKIMDGHYHIREPERVVEELKQIREDWTFLVDDEAFINGRRMIELAATIKRAGIRKKFFAYARIDSVIRQREVLRAWCEIGLQRLFIGIDAISDEELTDYQKRCKVSQIEKGLAITEELGIEVSAQFVVNPNYTHQDFKRLTRFIEHHKVRYPTFTVLTPIPGTALLTTFDHITERQPNGRPNWDLFDCQNPVTETRLGKEEFRRTYRNLYHVFKGAYTQYREHNKIIHDQSLV